MEKEELEAMQNSLIELMVRIGVIETLCIEKNIFTVEEHKEATKNNLRKFAEALSKKYNAPNLVEKMESASLIKE